MSEFVLAVSFVPFLVYFMLSWQDHVKAGLVQLFPARDRQVAALTLGKIASMMRAFVMGWPVAALVAFFAIPFARRVTVRIVALIEGTA